MYDEQEGADEIIHLPSKSVLLAISTVYEIDEVLWRFIILRKKGSTATRTRTHR